MKIFFRVILLFLLIWQNIDAQKPAATIPQFTFYKLDKTAFTNKDLQPGKPVLLVFFDATCDHCQHAMRTYNQHYRELDKTAVYLVTLDDQETIKRFMETYANNLYGRKNVTLLQDLRYEFIKKFGPRKYPSMFLYSGQKKLLIYDDEPKNIGSFLAKIKANSR